MPSIISDHIVGPQFDYFSLVPLHDLFTVSTSNQEVNSCPRTMLSIPSSKKIKATILILK